MSWKECSRCKKLYEGNKHKSCPHCTKSYNNERQKGYRDKAKDNMLTTARWRRLRAKIIRRDGGICLRCFFKYGIINGDRLQVHHIKSREHFPELKWDESNLITLCSTCNYQLGTTDKLDFEVGEVRGDG